MDIISPEFFAAVALAAPLYWMALPAAARPWALAALSLAFCASHAPLFTGLYLLLGVGAWGAGRAQAPPPPPAGGGGGGPGARPLEGRRRLLVAGLAALVVDLVLWKFVLNPASPALEARAATPGLAELAVPVGISYLTFRLIHYLVERYRGRAADQSLVDFLGWLFFFPVLLAGPLLRVGEWRAERPGLKDVNGALLRVGAGVFKKAVVADALGSALQPALLDPAAHSPLMVLAAVYGVALQLYLDFSGYSDIAIGLGRLFGVKVPENFDWPLTKTNIAEFWRSWHITLYTWIRDYVFFPLFGFRATRWKMYLGAGFSIFLFQVWHDLSWSFFALGLFHGVGVVGWHLFQRLKRRSKPLRRFVHHRGMRPIWIAVTVSWYAVGNVLFMTTPRDFVGVFSRILRIV